MINRNSVEDIIEDQEFKRLVRHKAMVSGILTGLQFFLYFGFIALIAFRKSILSLRLSADSAITIGIPLAVSVIILSWGLTGIYIVWTNKKYDVMVRKLKDRVTGG